MMLTPELHSGKRTYQVLTKVTCLACEESKTFFPPNVGWGYLPGGKFTKINQPKFSNLGLLVPPTLNFRQSLAILWKKRMKNPCKSEILAIPLVRKHIIR